MCGVLFSTVSMASTDATSRDAPTQSLTCFCSACSPFEVQGHWCVYITQTNTWLDTFVQVDQRIDVMFVMSYGLSGSEWKQRFFCGHFASVDGDMHRGLNWGLVPTQATQKLFFLISIHLNCRYNPNDYPIIQVVKWTHSQQQTELSGQ